MRPDQPGTGHQGARNEPCHVLDVARTIAELRAVSVEAIADATTRNARDLFDLPERRLSGGA